MDTGWNHNIHYHDLILGAVPSPCDRALDAGCGQGLLTRQLASRAETVVGIDLDLPSTPSAPANTTFLQGDIMTHPFPPASFSFIAAVATLHHLPLHPALPLSLLLHRLHGTAEVQARLHPPPRPSKTSEPPPPSSSPDPPHPPLAQARAVRIPAYLVSFRLIVVIPQRSGGICFSGCHYPSGKVAAPKTVQLPAYPSPDLTHLL